MNDPENYTYDVITAHHDDIKGGGGYPTKTAHITISRAEFPSAAVAAQVAGCMAASIYGGMPVAILEVY